MKKPLRVFALLLILLSCAYALLCTVRQPSNNRDWAPDQAVLPVVTMSGNLVTVRHVRNFDWLTRTIARPAYYNAIYDLRQLKRAWYVIEPFGTREGIAHTFLSFEFDGNRFVSVSVEARKEKDEEYTVHGGVLRSYELMYVIGDERDVIRVRSNIRKDEVYLYPVTVPEETVRELFLSMMRRAKDLAARPEFYNTITNNCTTNIAAHINAIMPGTIAWWDTRVLFPAYSDELAYDLGLIDTSAPLEEIREKYKINARAERYADDPQFSTRIRAVERVQDPVPPGRGSSTPSLHE